MRQSGTTWNISHLAMFWRISLKLGWVDRRDDILHKEMTSRQVPTDKHLQRAAALSFRMWFHWRSNTLRVVFVSKTPEDKPFYYFSMETRLFEKNRFACSMYAYIERCLWSKISPQAYWLSFIWAFLWFISNIVSVNFVKYKGMFE